MGILDWILGIAGGKTTKSYSEYEGNTTVEPDNGESTKYGLNFQQVIEAHQNWKNRLQKCIDGASQEKLDPEIVCCDDKCVLGIWIYSGGKEYFGDNPLYDEMKKTHAQFHIVAGEIVRKKLDGDTGGAKSMLQSGLYNQLSVKLQGMIARLYLLK